MQEIVRRRETRAIGDSESESRQRYCRANPPASIQAAEAGRDICEQQKFSIMWQLEYWDPRDKWTSQDAYVAWKGSAIACGAHAEREERYLADVIAEQKAEAVFSRIPIEHADLHAMHILTEALERANAHGHHLTDHERLMMSIVKKKYEAK